MIPTAPVRGPIPLPAGPLPPPAPETTHKTYSAYSASPSDISYYRTFYSKIHGWTNAVRPPSTNLGGRSAIWSEPEVSEGQHHQKGSQAPGVGSPTPSNPHPFPVSRMKGLEPHPSSRTLAEACQLPIRIPSVRSKPEPVIASGATRDQLSVPKYRPNETPRPSRPVSHNSSQSSQPSQRFIRDAYLAEALATPELEVMSPEVEVKTLTASKQASARRSAASNGKSLEAKASVVRSVSAPAHVASGKSQAQSPSALEPPKVASTKLPTTSRTHTVTGRSQGKPAASLQAPESLPLQSRRTTAAGAIPRHGRSLPDPVNVPLPPSATTFKSQSSNKPSRGPSDAPSHTGHDKSLRPTQTSEPLTWRQAAAMALPPSVDTASSQSPLRAQVLPRTPHRSQQHVEPHLLPLPPSRPTLRTQPSSSSIFPGSALGGRSLGRKQRDQSAVTLQARFEPAVYPLPPSASTATIVLPPAHNQEPSPVDQHPSSKHASNVGQDPREAVPTMLPGSDDRHSRPPPTPYLPRHVKVATDDQFSFDVPSGDRRRLHISLAWLKDGTATPRTLASEVDRGPPVPSKSPKWRQPDIPRSPEIPLRTLNSKLLHNPQLMVSYPQPYPQPGVRPYGNIGFTSLEQRPLSPPAPFPPPRNRGPYPESMDSFLSDPHSFEPVAEKSAHYPYPASHPLPTNYPTSRFWQPDRGYERPQPDARVTATQLIQPDDSISRVTRGYRQQGYRNRSDSNGSDEQPKLQTLSARRGLWDKVKGFTQKAGQPAASRWSRNETMQVGGHSQPPPSGMFQRDRINWNRSRVHATHVDRLEQREREDRLRAEREELRRKAAEWRRRERRARRAEEKARRAEDRRVRRLQREQAQQSVRRRFADFSARNDGRSVRPDLSRRHVSQSSGRDKSRSQPKIPKLPWRERLKQTRQPANYYKARTGQAASAPAPPHHYEATQGPGSSHVARWRQAQSKLSRSQPAERANDVPCKQVNGWRIRWVLEKWFEA